VAVVNGLATQPGFPPDLLGHAAVVYALSADAARQSERAEEYATRAVECLRRLRAAGWLRATILLRDLREHPDFAGLRARADYQRLVKVVTRDANSAGK